MDTANYEKIKQQLVDKGIEITHEEEWKENLHSFYFEDPEGNVLEVMHGKLWG